MNTLIMQNIQIVGIIYLDAVEVLDTSEVVDT